MKRATYCIMWIFLTPLLLLGVLLVYRAIFRIDYSVIIAACCFVGTFPISVSLCRYGQREIKKQERLVVTAGNHTASDKRILALCLSCMAPIYWGILLVAFIPIVKPEMFFITLFPALILSSISAKIVCDTYHSFTHRRMLFLCIHTALLALLALIGQIPIRLLFMA